MFAIFFIFSSLVIHFSSRFRSDCLKKLLKKALQNKAINKILYVRLWRPYCNTLEYLFPHTLGVWPHTVIVYCGYFMSLFMCTCVLNYKWVFFGIGLELSIVLHPLFVYHETPKWIEVVLKLVHIFTQLTQLRTPEKSESKLWTMKKCGLSGWPWRLVKEPVTGWVSVVCMLLFTSYPHGKWTTNESYKLVNASTLCLWCLLFLYLSLLLCGLSMNCLLYETETVWIFWVEVKLWFVVIYGL